MAVISSGDMTRRVRILQPVDTLDDRGSSPATYKADGAPIWAKIEPLAAQEMNVADGLEAVATHRVTVYRTDRITSRSVLEATLDGRRFEIVSLLNVEERDRYLELRCREAIA